MKIRARYTFPLLIPLLFVVIGCGAPKELQWNASMPAKTLFFTGQELYEQGYLKDALEVFRTIITNFPDDLYHCAWSQYEIGNIFYDKERWDKALEAFEAVVAYETTAIDLNKIDEVRQPVRLARLLIEKIEQGEQHKNSTYSSDPFQELD